MDFLAHELAGLSGRRFPLASVLSRTFDRLFVWQWVLLGQRSIEQWLAPPARTVVWITAYILWREAAGCGDIAGQRHKGHHIHPAHLAAD
jgi:hypothetical protein